MSEEAGYISVCRQVIENKLAWGNSNDWQNSDFDNLSQKIFEATHVMLSSSTLKRIWGKVQYKSTPNRATLDALAQFAGYKTWRDFIATQNNKAVQEAINIPDVPAAIPTVKSSTSYKTILPIAFFALLVIFVAFRFVNSGSDLLNFKNVAFASKPVTKGVPNTVVFNYDATNSNADSVFIQQSWDSRKRFRVDKQLHEYTTTYYYPGYYRAKLVLNDSIIKEEDVYIETVGWTGIIHREPTPIYLPGDLFKDSLAITQQQLVAQGIDAKKEPVVCSLNKVDKGINIPASNLLFEARVQNTLRESNSVCQYTNILIMATKGVISIPLCKAGCVGEIGLMLGMQHIDGRTHDLSGFGVDFSQPVTVGCATKNGQIILTVNKKPVFKQQLLQDIGNVVGMQVKFNGIGSVSNIKLQRNE